MAEDSDLDRAREGDREAFGRLVQRYQRRVYAAALHILGNHSDADDVAQETFLKAYRRLTYFRGDSKFSTWLIAIAYNEMRQMQRKRTHQNKIVAALSLEVHDGHAEAPEEVHDLPKVLAWLEEEERAAMLLSYVYGYSHREISLVTGLPVGTVKSKLNRARVRILERMNATVIQHV